MCKKPAMVLPEGPAGSWRSSLLVFAALLGLLLGATPAHSASTPVFVQGNSKQITSGATNALAFTASNTAGNLIVAYVVWNNQGAVDAVRLTRQRIHQRGGSDHVGLEFPGPGVLREEHQRPG